MAAAKGNNYNPNGPPTKDIDWHQFEQLCSLQCTQSEIASFLKVHTDTLRDHARIHYGIDDYSEIYKKFSETGKVSLRRNQFILSKTNASMAIWLGKQMLGQSDYNDKNNQPLTLESLRAFINEVAKEQPGSEPHSRQELASQ